MAKRKRKVSSLPILDPGKVRYYRFVLELTVGEFKKKALLTDQGLQKIRQGRPISMDKARKVAAAIGVPLLEILDPRQRLELMSSMDLETMSEELPDWQLGLPLSGPITTSNQLVYHVWKLKHVMERRRIGGSARLGRGKRYDPRGMPTKEQLRLSDYLARHGDICNELGGSDLFPRHVTTAPAPDRSTWWSVDEWTEGRTLTESIDRGEIPAEAVPQMMRNLAEGLRLLHEAGIIYREMSTRSIIVTDVDKGSVVLTDFELGKLLDGSPTVRGSGPGNPYQAKEVEGKKLTKTDTHVDWYSWGRILLHAATGGLPTKNKEGPCLEQAELPEQVKKIVAKCLSPNPPARPRQADEVLKGISGWR